MGRYNKRSDFPSPAHHAVVKAIEASDPSGGRRFHELFDDFIALGALTMQQGVQCMINQKKCPQIEAEHGKIAARYKPEGMAAMQQAFAHLVEAIEGPKFKEGDDNFEGGDVLGDIFMCCDMGNAWRGQVFTPMPICKLLTSMTLDRRAPNREERFMVNEPRIGGGAMILALAQNLREQQFLPFHWWFDATDIDYRCFHMAYLQLSLINAPGIVRRGDSLRMEFDRHWITPLGAMFPLKKRDIARLRGEDKKPPVPSERQALIDAAKAIYAKKHAP